MDDGVAETADGLGVESADGRASTFENKEKSGSIKDTDDEGRIELDRERRPEASHLFVECMNALKSILKLELGEMELHNVYRQLRSFGFTPGQRVMDWAAPNYTDAPCAFAVSVAAGHGQHRSA
ncbi:hypothetical protein BGZ51_008750 [Haplosporangium sp. Z 767]|nr:hypothetical protein BGZ51_008750 [Haplosporangium sp. Z 767]